MLIPISNAPHLNLIIDEDVYPLILKHNDTPSFSMDENLCVSFWSKSLYMKIHIGRFIMNEPDFSGMEVDHKNRNKLDNRRENLRVVDRITNARNHAKLEGCSSSFKGVSWNRRKRKWLVQICINRIAKFGGYFKDEVEAAIKADDMMLEYGYDLWNLNFPVVYGA